MYQKSLFPVEDLRRATLMQGFGFTQGVPLLKVPARRNAQGQPVGHLGQGGGYQDTTTVLYDLATDPEQQRTRAPQRMRHTPAPSTVTGAGTTRTWAFCPARGTWAGARTTLALGGSRAPAWPRR